MTTFPRVAVEWPGPVAYGVFCAGSVRATRSTGRSPSGRAVAVANGPITSSFEERL